MPLFLPKSISSGCRSSCYGQVHGQAPDTELLPGGRGVQGFEGREPCTGLAPKAVPEVPLLPACPSRAGKGGMEPAAAPGLTAQ